MVNVTTERHSASVVVFEAKAIVTKPHVLETNKPDVRRGQTYSGLVTVSINTSTLRQYKVRASTSLFSENASSALSGCLLNDPKTQRRRPRGVTMDKPSGAAVRYSA